MKLKKHYNCCGSKKFKQIYYKLKLIECPHCRCVGYLILHGYLRGYMPESCCRKIIRGRRLFCSNRDRRKGCGKTITIFIATAIKNFTITTNYLWDYLNNLFNGSNKSTAFKELNLPFSITSVYRLYKRFFQQQPLLREQLMKVTKPPQIQSANPLFATISHIKHIFVKKADPLSAFQQHFQTSIL